MAKKMRPLDIPHNGRMFYPRSKYPTIRPDKQPHATVKQEYLGLGEWRVVICNCPVCNAYLAVIAQLNPDRHHKITHPEPPVIRRRSEQQKQFSNDKFKRDNRGKTLSRYFSK